MMNLRKSCLPSGWYPRDPVKVREFLDIFAAKPLDKPLIAAVAPHAGWYYSGAIAARAVAALALNNSAPDTVAVIGGHLPDGMPALFALEDAADTPLGPLEMDDGLRNALLSAIPKESQLKTAEDRYQDNTVEVLLPMVKHFFPETKLLWLRLPADIRSFDAGKTLARTAASLGKKIIVLGSTDLTHYGVNYGFTPKGSGKAALDWVKDMNDRRFIDAVQTGDFGAVLERADTERSACSAGAVLGTMGFAAECREKNGSAKTGNLEAAGALLSYETSADIMLNEGEPLPGSFVGYGAFVWEA